MSGGLTTAGGRHRSGYAVRTLLRVFDNKRPLFIRQRDGADGGALFGARGHVRSRDDPPFD